jgi:hypothetical protein
VDTVKILAIDPGPVESAYAIYDTQKHAVIEANKIGNGEVLNALVFFKRGEAGGEDEYQLVIEMIAAMGMAVGAEVFETCVWIGRFMQVWGADRTARIKRGDVKMYLCESMRAKDKNITQAIKDMFPATGGGKDPSKGTKAKPGPLYGVSKDMWAALGVALTYADRLDRRERRTA